MSCVNRAFIGQLQKPERGNKQWLSNIIRGRGRLLCLPLKGMLLKQLMERLSRNSTGTFLRQIKFLVQSNVSKADAASKVSIALIALTKFLLPSRGWRFVYLAGNPVALKYLHYSLL